MPQSQYLFRFTFPSIFISGKYQDTLTYKYKNKHILIRNTSIIFYKYVLEKIDSDLVLGYSVVALVGIIPPSVSVVPEMPCRRETPPL